MREHFQRGSLNFRDKLFAIDYILVATKSDKLSRSEKNRRLQTLQEIYLKGQEAIAFSSNSGEGRKELWKWISSRMEQRSEL